MRRLQLSIIIPSYNVECYIEQCIESCLNQTISSSFYEIIVVDDGSTDNTCNIMEKYTDLDNITIVHQSNDGAPGKARNIGVEMAKGDYVMFVDSDDILPKDACAKLLRAIQLNDLDLVVGNRVDFNESSTKISMESLYLKIRFNIFKRINVLFNNKLNFLDISILNLVVHTRIIKRETILKYNIKFPEKVPSQDTSFSYCLFINRIKMAYLNEIVYMRRVRSDEMNKSLTQTITPKMINGRMQSCLFTINYFKENNVADEFLCEFIKMYIYAINGWIRKANFNQENSKAYYEILKKLHCILDEHKILHYMPKDIKLQYHGIQKKENIEQILSYVYRNKFYPVKIYLRRFIRKVSV